MWRPQGGPSRLTYRRLLNLIRYLPREAAFVREVHGDKVLWGVAEHLLAQAINDQRQFKSGKKSLPESRLVRPPGAVAKPAVNGHQKPGGVAELNALFDGR